MLNLSEITSYYIEHKFSPEMKVLLLDAFSLMEVFGMNFYEDKYIDLINRYETISSEDMVTQFVAMVKEDLNVIINSHAVYLDEETDIQLSERLDICHGLLILANLEDFSYVKYRVNTDQPDKTIFIDLIERYTLLPRARCMEIISEVKESLIASLREVSEREEEVTAEQLDLKHKQHVDRFFKYTEGTPSLAKSLNETGFLPNLTLEELVNLLTFDMTEHISKLSTTQFPQAVLDIFSLMVYTKDDFTLPIFKFKKNALLFTNDADLTARISNTLFKMVDDFALFVKACEEREKLNVN